MSFDSVELFNKKVIDLRKIAKKFHVSGILKKNKPDLIDAIVKASELLEMQTTKNSNIPAKTKTKTTPSKQGRVKPNNKENSRRNISQSPRPKETLVEPQPFESTLKTKTKHDQKTQKTQENSSNPTSPNPNSTKDQPIQSPQNNNQMSQSSSVTVPLPPSAFINRQNNTTNSNSTVTPNSLSGSVSEPFLHEINNNSVKPQPSQKQSSHPNGQNILQQQIPNENTVPVQGVLDLINDNSHGVLRSHKLVPSDKDTYISLSQVKKFKLKKGDFVKGLARQPKENERYFSLLWISEINGLKADDKSLQNRAKFEDFKPIYPDKQLVLETDQQTISTRFIDLLAPIGYGQRSMIVAQPKSGKTFILKDIAKGINTNYPEIQLIVVLIGERPEEVTDIERSVNGLVFASNFDESPQDQVIVAELALERGKRMVEMGKDVVILMDSLTRLARAYNVALPASGRTLSGGLDPASLYPSKKFFGAARNFENGSSLTIVATSLVDTGSKMDDVIFEEFKGTGNNELYLDRGLADKRIFPALNWSKSGTRNEDLLLGQEKLQASWRIRKMLAQIGDDGIPALLDKLKTTKNNQEFLNTINS